MTEMNAQQTMEYLKQLSDLETSVYQQKKVREKAHATLVKPNIKKRIIEKPKENDFTYARPTEPSLKDCFMEKTWIPIVGACSILVGLFLFLSDTDSYGFMAWGFGIAILVILIGGMLSVRTYLEEKKEYAQKWENYERAYKKAKDAYRAAMDKYNSAVLTADKQYAEEQRAAQQAYHLALAEVQKLDAPFEDTQKLLSRIYDADIIFPKYRNMVAMCTMYEYFASGRCTELMGPTGAYNLYEAELRQNLIINQLEKVNANLEQVKQNQYILYQGIAETNKVLGEVSADIKGVLNMTTDIAISSRITAFCSQITAKNAVAQTYLELMN